MIKKQNKHFAQALYEAPECSIFSISAESAIAVSGNGNIDDGTVKTWGEGIEGIDDLLPGIDNNLLF